MNDRLLGTSSGSGQTENFTAQLIPLWETGDVITADRLNYHAPVILVENWGYGPTYEFLKNAWDAGYREMVMDFNPSSTFNINDYARIKTYFQPLLELPSFIIGDFYKIDPSGSCQFYHSKQGDDISRWDTYINTDDTVSNRKRHVMPKFSANFLRNGNSKLCFNGSPIYASDFRDYMANHHMAWLNGLPLNFTDTSSMYNGPWYFGTSGGYKVSKDGDFLTVEDVE